MKEYEVDQFTNNNRNRLVDVVPIIDRDISKAYAKELSPMNIMDSV